MSALAVKRKSPPQIIIRKAAQGDAVSVLVVVDDRALEFTMPPAQALQIGGSLISEARVAQFGEFANVSTGELDAAPSAERMLDMAILSVNEVLKQFKPVPVCNAAAGTA